MSSRSSDVLEWEEVTHDNFVAWRRAGGERQRAGGERQRVGVVRRVGEGWFWAPDGVEPLYGPVPTRDEAARHLAAGLPGVEASPPPSH